jgi:quinol monooxygenase YgiN
MSWPAAGGPPDMIIVIGHLVVAADVREVYLSTCREVVEQARRTSGCLDFAISADLLDPGRVNIVERWEGREQLEAFRGAGVDDDQAAMISSASVVEYEVGSEHALD